MTDYYALVKGLSDQLASVGHPLADKELMIYILSGIDASYDAFATGINLKGGDMTLDELYAHILDYELLHNTTNSSYQISANAAERGNSGGGRSGHGGY